MFVKRYGMILSAVFFASAQPSFGACNTIDAVTSATRDMSVKGGSACETTASINWTEKHGYGSGYFEYGTSTGYGQKSNISGGSGTVNISGLTSNTKYYYHFFMDGHDKPDHRCNFLGTFQTSAAAVQPPVITSAASVTCTTGTTKTYTATATDPANKTVTFTFSGQPSWITSSGATLTLKPTATSQNSTVKIIATNGTAADTLNLSVTVVATTAVLNDNGSGKQLSVNIGKTQFFVPLNDEKSIAVSLFSLDGALLMKRTVSVANVKMDRSIHLGSQMFGTYICKVYTRSGEISQKIVLQK